MINKFPISKEGLSKLKMELKNLKSVERVHAISSIVKAREYGDLSENSEYHAARENQSFIEAKICELENKISRAEIIDTSNIFGEKVKYGASVKLLDKDNQLISEYKIVSDYESNVSKGLISILSPLAKALIGRKSKESLQFKTPKGIKHYYIISVKFL